MFFTGGDILSLDMFCTCCFFCFSARKASRSCCVRCRVWSWACISLRFEYSWMSLKYSYTLCFKRWAIALVACILSSLSCSWFYAFTPKSPSRAFLYSTFCEPFDFCLFCCDIFDLADCIWSGKLLSGFLFENCCCSSLICLSNSMILCISYWVWSKNDGGFIFRLLPFFVDLGGFIDTGSAPCIVDIILACSCSTPRSSSW